MGYFGFPSKACSHCRSRRIKCDLSLPSCGQCVRGRRTCFGYRNPQDLVFHDQSEAVARKAQHPKRVSCDKAARPPVTVAPMIDDLVYTKSKPEVTDRYSNATTFTTFSFPVTAASHALTFFFNNYPSLPSKNFDSIYREIPAVYCTEPSDGPLMCIITALGLAGLSHHTETSGMEVATAAWYGKALYKVNESLRDQSLAKLDQTLLVVLLLGLYETNTCDTPGSMNFWLNHIRGATALLALRGDNQLDSSLGSTLFIQARTQIVSGCYLTRTPIPDIVVCLSRKIHARGTDPLETLNLRVVEFCDIRADTPFHPLVTQSESTTRAAVTSYTLIAEALAIWQDSLSAAFLPSTVPVVSASATVLSDHYDVYEDIWTAGIANNYHSHSLLVQEALIKQLEFLRDRYCYDLDEVLEIEDQITLSHKTMLSHIHSICASVPDLLQTNLAAAGVGMLWPLYVCAQISALSDPLHKATRNWIIGRLRKIGKEMGVRQATMMVRILDNEVEIVGLLKDD